MGPTIGVDGTPLYRRVDGIGRYSANLLRAVAGARPDWRFVVIGFADDRSQPYLLEPLANVEQVYLPLPRRWYQAAYSYRVRLPVGRWLPPLDALLAPNYARFPWLGAVPTAVVVYDLTYVDLPGVVERRNLGHLRRTVPATVARADAVLAISDFTAERIEQTFPGHAPLSVVDCGLDPAFLAPARAARLDLPAGYLLCVGTLEPRKNLVTLLRAWASLEPGLRAAHPLVVVGKAGWGPDDVPADVPRDVLDQVRFTGYVPDADLPAVYRGARAFVFPSRYEGFGLPLLEAMSAGVPTVAADIPPFRAIGRDLVDYADPDQPEAFAAALRRVLAGRDEARLAAAAAHARTFTWQRSAEQAVAVLERLVGAPTG